MINLRKPQTRKWPTCQRKLNLTLKGLSKSFYLIKSRLYLEADRLEVDPFFHNSSVSDEFVNLNGLFPQRFIVSCAFFLHSTLFKSLFLRILFKECHFFWKGPSFLRPLIRRIALRDKVISEMYSIRHLVRAKKHYGKIFTSLKISEMFHSSKNTDWNLKLYLSEIPTLIPTFF